MSGKELKFTTFPPEVKKVLYSDDFQLSTEPIRKIIENFHENVAKALDEYFQFKYSISDEQLGNIIRNTNNFKLKHDKFYKVVQFGTEFYYDDDVIFLEVDRTIFTVDKRW